MNGPTAPIKRKILIQASPDGRPSRAQPLPVAGGGLDHGVYRIPALYALGFLLLDIALIASHSPLTSAAKLFMFFTIPLLYSPFLFVLHGGVVVVGILCYQRLLQRGAFAFMGFRPQTEQLTR